MKYIASAIISTFVVTACASGPDYRQAASPNGEGYSQKVIESDRYRVSYKLNEDHIGKAQDYALLRAAELTMEQGYETFEVVYETASTSEEDRDTFNTRLSNDVVVTRDCGLLSCRTTARPVLTQTEIGTFSTDSETMVTLEIRLSDADADTSPRMYDASEVAANIRMRR